MKLWIIATILFMISGCYYNDTGVSTKIYDNCKEYYDENGKYQKECDKNLADYTEIKEYVGDKYKKTKEYIKDELNQIDHNLRGSEAMDGY